MQENAAITQKKSKERQIQTAHSGGWGLGRITPQ